MVTRHPQFCTLALLAVSALFGCSTKSSPAGSADLSNDGSAPPSNTPRSGGGAGEAGSDGGIVDEAGEGGVACNMLSLDNTLIVQRTAVPDVLPLAMGGAIVDGTYAITKYEVYTGAAGAVGMTGGSIQGLIVVTGTMVQSLVVINGVAPHVVTYTFATVDSQITTTHTCPDTAVTVDGYSVINGNAIAFLSSANKEVLTFTKQ